jgi:hypothetical protein
MKDHEVSGYEYSVQEINGMINDTFRSIMMKKIFNMVIWNQEVVISKNLEAEMEEEMREIEADMEEVLLEIQTRESERALVRKDKYFWKLLEHTMGIENIRLVTNVLQKNKSSGNFRIGEMFYIVL